MNCLPHSGFFSMETQRQVFCFNLFNLTYHVPLTEGTHMHWSHPCVFIIPRLLLLQGMCSISDKNAHLRKAYFEKNKPMHLSTVVFKNIFMKYKSISIWLLFSWKPVLDHPAFLSINYWFQCVYGVVPGHLSKLYKLFFLKRSEKRHNLG